MSQLLKLIVCRQCSDCLHLSELLLQHLSGCEYDADPRLPSYEILEAVHTGETVALVCLDLSGASDTINHVI
jgi:hypothetical protein